MSAEKFVEASRPYWKDGIISLKLPYESTDNAYLFGSTWHFILGKLYTGKIPFVSVHQELLLDVLFKNRIERGLYHPMESWDERTLSHDELLGIVLLHEALAEDVVSYGRRHLWVFNNRGIRRDIPSQWMGRFPTKIAYFYSRARVMPFHPFNHLFAACEFLFADRDSPYGETSGKCMRYLMADFFYQQGNFLMKWAADVYLRRLQKQYGTVGKLYDIYFPGHPLAIYTQDLKFIEGTA